MTLGERSMLARDLATLPELVLLHIFSFCELKTLINLAKVCRLFNKLSEESYLWRNLYRTYTVTGLDDHHLTLTAALTPSPPSSSNTNISSLAKSSIRARKPMKEKCRTCGNWENGNFNEIKLISEDVRQMPCLQLVGDHLYATSRNELNCYPCLLDGRLCKAKKRTFKGHRKDITSFACYGDNVVGADLAGNIMGWDHSSSRKQWSVICEPQTDVNCVDLYNDIVAAGTKNGLVKIWGISMNVAQRFVLNTNDRVWTLKINPTGDKFLCGTAGLHGIPPIRLYDLTSGLLEMTLINSPRNGAGILDATFDDPSTLFTCGYDTCIRQWDLRMNCMVRMWEDPDDVSLYCLKSRTAYSLVCGTARHGLTRLWDKRLANPVQTYYPKKICSPVYALDYTTDHLYIALDRGIHMLDFTVYNRTLQYY